ncbi:hypothetical protein JKF63_01222 [Porcisia hertigi]|uniref:Autophagy-related protein 2 n=1 Tax=Porcisia hertigi TaxID=2761500 RepID=A0A836IE09_9TRYP|nr:hypothetical protein JKF63_01222 [Porcisia hertigi]
MNFVNAYLLLPLQRKIFKNFGHYDYQTSTFHLNEERVNEVFFDPAYNPFVDVLRETSHASAVASSKAAAAAVQHQHQHRTLSFSGQGRSTLSETDAALRTTPPPPSQPRGDSADNETAAAVAPEESEKREGAKASAPRSLPVRLLSGKIRSAGLLPFLRQVMSQKSLSVDSMDMVFDLTTAAVADSTGGSHTAAPCLVAQPVGGPSDAKDDIPPQPDPLFSATAVAGSSAAEDSEDVSPSSPPFFSSTLTRHDEVATLARSYSIEDYSSLQHRGGDQSSSLDPTEAERGDSVTDDTSPTPDAVNRPGSLKEGHSTRFHTVGDLMTYLKQQLQGLTVGVEEVRLTFCVPPVGVAGSLVRSTDTAGRCSGRPKAAGQTNAAGVPLCVRRGTRVLHLSCRRGLRFTVDDSTAASVEDMQCTASIQDWQCYVHVMTDDGPLPSEFSLDDLIFATPTTHTTASLGQSLEESASDARSSVNGAPFTVHVARRGVESAANTATPSTSPLSVPADVSLSPKVLIAVNAAKGWSVVLSTVQVAHLVGMIRQVLGCTADSGEGTASEEGFSAYPSPVQPIRTVAELGKQVVAAPIDIDKAVTEAALTATQMRTATKYVSVHCSGGSITLLTQPVVDTSAVARAWRCALSSRQLAFLDPQSTNTLRHPDAGVSLPVYEILTTPHLTYVMRDVDVLFPNIDAEVPRSSPTSSPTASGIFQQSAKKRKIYRRIFDNKLVDRAVTEQLRRTNAAASSSNTRGGASLFLGVGSVSFMEYRHATSATGQHSTEIPSSFPATKSRDLPFWAPVLSHSVRPARVMHAERSPYALVFFHRSTPPLQEQKPSGASLSPPLSPGLRIYQETVVVGLANISVQLDPGLLEVLAVYGTTVQELIYRVSDGQQGCEAVPSRAAETLASPTGSPAGKLSPPPSAPSPSPVIRTRSSVKVLLESVDASIRFPVNPNAPPASLDFSSHPLGGASRSTDSPPPTPPAPESLLLSRLLQRLRESSLDTHRHNRSFIRRQARRVDEDGNNVAPSPKSVDKAAVASAITVQEQLGFPEDMDARARFLPEWLRFSLRDLQVVHTPSATTATRGDDVTVPASTVYTPASTSVKWREAVVYLQDILEETKSELLRVNYSHEMNISVTHTSLPSLAGGGWRALERVLALQVRLGEITTTALTQDDYLLATHYVNELLLAFSRCRQRLHAGRVAAAARARTSTAPSGDRVPLVAVAAVQLESLPLPGEAGTSLAGVSDESPSLNHSGGVVRPSECREEPLEHPAGLLAEAFAMSCAQTTTLGSVEASVDRCAGSDSIPNHTPEPKLQESITHDNSDVAGSLRKAVPELWRLLDTTCTSLDVRISRIRLGLFAPRLSPMGQVIGEPLYRCLPKAQRRCLVDLNCLYHLYIMLLVDVSVCGLSGDGALARAGKANYARLRLGGFSLWERQPEPPLTSRDGREAGGAAAVSSLYTSYASNYGGPGSSPPESHGQMGGTIRDLAYYMSSSQTAHSGHRRQGTLVQLLQSYTDARTNEEEQEEEAGCRGEEDSDGANANRNDQWVGRSSRALTEIWGAYVRELELIASTPESAAHAPALPGRESGVCEVRFLETAGVPPIAPSPDCPCTVPLAPTDSITAPAPSNCRHLWLQLTALSLHHTVAYSGDHLAAVLKQYFSGGGGTVAPGEFVVRDVGEASNPAEGVSTPASEEPLWTTKVHVDIVNLMATYRPHGAGRSLAVLLLPRASVLVHIPATPPMSSLSTAASEGIMQPGELRGSGATARSSATSLPAPASADVSAPLTTRAWAWLHTPLPLYVCNDCDVEMLVREVLEPAEGDDWGVDLESAGFVRLCEVISTAARSSSSSVAADVRRCTDDSGASRTANFDPLSQTPNLLITVRPRRSSVSALGAGGGADAEVGPSIDYAYLAPAMSVELQHIELSAFMAKDSFEVFRELVEAWGSGADLKAADAPAALVMRSGPGFEWVAEEVARSCAPMTFRMNPHLMTSSRNTKADASSEVSRPSPLGPPAMRTVVSVDDYTSHYPLPLPTTPLQASRAFVSPWGVSEKAQLASSARAGGGFSASFSARGSSANAYGYDHWLDALHASHGRDPQLYEAYQRRVAQLLDGAPWVPVRHSVNPASPNEHVIKQKRMPPSQSSTSQSPAFVEVVPPLQYSSEMADIISLPSDDDDDGGEGERVKVKGGRAVLSMGAVCGTHRRESSFSPMPPLPRGAAASKICSMSSSFSDLEDTVASGAQMQWHVLAPADRPASPLLSSGDDRHRDHRADSNAVAGDARESEEATIDLFAVCDQQPHFLSCWSRGRVEAARERRAVRLNRLDCTDDSYLHDTADKYLYPPVELEFFLSGCSINFSLYEGNDLMPAAVRKQRRGYLQIVSRGANLAQAASYIFDGDKQEEEGQHVANGSSDSADTNATPVTACTAAPAHDSSHIQDGWMRLSFSRCSRSTTADKDATCTAETGSMESSASRLQRLHDRGCRSGFGDRNANKRLVLSCRDITVQMDTFSQASEEDLWFHVVVGESTVFDCIDTSDVHRLLTATPKPPASRSAYPRGGSSGGHFHAGLSDFRPGGSGGANDERQLELTGLLSSSKGVRVAASGDVMKTSRASFTVSHFQQGGSELSLVVRLQPTSLTWSGASVDFVQSFFSPTSASLASSPSNHTGATNAAASLSAVPETDAGTISGTEAPPLFYRRVVILPTTVTAAGSFQSDKGVLAALSEGSPISALRSIPVLSWISLQEIPLPIPFMRIEDCSTAAALLQRIVEDSNCVSVRFLLTACCCGLQPLSAVTRVGEAAKDLLLLPLSNYRGAALHHAIRTASSVFMQELLTQTSDMAALLTSGSYHASRSLLEALLAPEYRASTIAEPSRASQPTGVVDGWRQGQQQLRAGLQEALTMASNRTGPDQSLLRVPAAALRLLMSVSGAATTTLWGVRNSQGSDMRERDGYIYKRKY